MTDLLNKWSIWMVIVKTALIVINTVWVAGEKTADQTEVFECDTYGWTLIYTDSVGHVYWLIFTLHNFFFVNMCNTVFFEGGIMISLFGEEETPDWTMCMYCCTCCMWDFATKVTGSELEMSKLSRQVRNQQQHNQDDSQNKGFGLDEEKELDDSEQDGYNGDIKFDKGLNSPAKNTHDVTQDRTPN